MKINLINVVPDRAYPPINIIGRSLNLVSFIEFIAIEFLLKLVLTFKRISNTIPITVIITEYNLSCLSECEKARKKPILIKTIFNNFFA